VVDQGSSAVLTWADPYAGQMRYVVEYGAGAKLVADSSTRTVVSGLSPGRGYCFAVGVPIVTAEAGARVVLSDPVCIRGASTAPSVSAP
jgi:hypothetical protein